MFFLIIAGFKANRAQNKKVTLVKRYCPAKKRGSVLRGGISFVATLFDCCAHR
jgi:hypothetical protein